MGKYEVLGYLSTLRTNGDHRYFRYGDIHEGIKAHGVSNSYTSIWRSVNSLFSDGLLEVEFEGGVIQRTAKFRYKLPSEFHSSYMKRVHNIYRKQQESCVRKTTRGVLHG